ncbi:hypothetical protein ACOMHN_015961 [Nucella lapillus]
MAVWTVRAGGGGGLSVQGVGRHEPAAIMAGAVAVWPCLPARPRWLHTAWRQRFDRLSRDPKVAGWTVCLVTLRSQVGPSVS